MKLEEGRTGWGSQTVHMGTAIKIANLDLSENALVPCSAENASKTFTLDHFARRPMANLDHNQSYLQQIGIQGSLAQDVLIVLFVQRQHVPQRTQSET